MELGAETCRRGAATQCAKGTVVSESQARAPREESSAGSDDTSAESGCAELWIAAASAFAAK